MLQRRVPIQAPIATTHAPWTKSKRMVITERQDRLAQAREEIAMRVANFKVTQEKFQREREEYFVATMKNARHGNERPRFWSQAL